RQLAQAAEQRVTDDSTGNLLRLAYDQAGERDPRHDDQEEREGDHESRGELGPDPQRQPFVYGGEHGVQDRDTDEPGGVGRERDDERDTQEKDEQRRTLMVRVEQGHARRRLRRRAGYVDLAADFAAWEIPRAGVRGRHAVVRMHVGVRAGGGQRRDQVAQGMAGEGPDQV